MGIIPEKSWSGRHPTLTTIIIILLIVGAGAGLKLLQNKYFPPPKPPEYKVPVLINESFQDVDRQFKLYSNLSEDQKDILFKDKYVFNIFNWTCRPLGCEKMIGKSTLKLICKESGFTEDVRIAMDEDCAEAAQKLEVTVLFQLVTRTTGEYYLGRAGRIINK
jgi:hypothetical protein